METPDLPDRVALLERMADQQLFLNDLLIRITGRLEQEQGLHAEAMSRQDRLLQALAAEHFEHADRLARYDAILTRLDEESARHAEHMAELRQILAAIKDMLERGNGH